jgi:hypothetical protein
MGRQTMMETAIDGMVLASCKSCGRPRSATVQAAARAAEVAGAAGAGAAGARAVTHEVEVAL